MKLKLLALLVLGLSLSVGCEDDNDDKSSSSSTLLLERSIVVSATSRDVIGGSSGDVYQFDGDDWRVIVTDKTQIYIQRDSCSGLDKSNPESVRVGQTLLFKYDPEKVDYIGSPNVVRSPLIEVYRPECISPVP